MSDANPYTCIRIDTRCHLSDSIYGYYPTLPGNAIFLAVSVACLLTQVFLGIRSRTWTFLLVMCCGCFAESIGFVGRVLLHYNPFSNAGFNMQVCCLIMGPAWLAIGIYLTLKHLVIAYGPQYSYLKPAYYTWIFISLDAVSLSLQAAGGGLAAGAEDHPEQMTLGNNLAISGIVMQVATLAVFAALGGLYFVRRHCQQKIESMPTSLVMQTVRFKCFLGALTVAFVTIFIRCVYRIPELSGGWASPLMMDEGLFIALDNMMVLVAMVALTVCHPGLCFPQMARPYRFGAKEAFGTMEEGKVTSRETMSEAELSDPPANNKEEVGYFGGLGSL